MWLELFKNFISIFTTHWKILTLRPDPTISFLYRTHDPGKFTGITHQEDDWNGVRLDDRYGNCVANFYDTQHIGIYKGIDKCMWTGVFVKDKEHEGQVVLTNVKIKKVY